MTFSRPAFHCVIMAGAFAATFSGTANGAIFFDSGVTSLTLNSPIQMGRLSRSGVISDWSTTKPYPGEINTSTSYRYTTYDIPISYFPFLQISFDDISGGANTFISAYLNSYNPAQKSVNYLGDEGSSGNYFGTIPTAFQVVVNPGNDLILVVNDASPVGAGVGQDYRILVEGFSDTNFNETPEPSKWGLTGLGLAGGFLLYFLKKKSAVKKGLSCE